MKFSSGKIFLAFVMTAAFSSAFMWRCANIAAPQGGDKDTLPPRILTATPDFNTVDFTAKRVYITFDEYVVLKDQQKEFFSSPPMKKAPTLTIKGRGVQIDLRDTLLENTTYALNFGSSIVDNNEGNPLHGFRYVFSTGPEIDSMFMSGYVVDAFSKDSVGKALIYFFDARADSMKLDSTIFNATPLALGRAETNGLFLAQNLKPMNYRVYAVDDRNNNFMYDPGSDRIAFLDGTFNPADMEGFDVRFDTTWMYLVPEPQLFFRTFTDTHFKRQNLSNSSRPEQHRVQLVFSAPYPEIDTLLFEGIDDADIITEYLKPTRDSVNYWFNVPSETLPDTIKVRINYMRHDSVNVLQPYGTDLKLVWRLIESREERREREREEKKKEEMEARGEEYTPPVKPNPFSHTLSTTGQLNPEETLSITFKAPIVAIDTARIALTREDELGLKYDVAFGFGRDTADMKRYNILAQWTEGGKYELLIPENVFTDVAGLRNDSIKSGFTVLSADQFGMLNVRVKGKSDNSLYVLTLYDKSNRPVREKKFVTTGTHTFRFLPAGEYRLHVLEDINGNGIWDTGSVIERRQPERIEVYGAGGGSDLLAVKVNWEIDIDVDMSELFRPFDIMDVRRDVLRRENLRQEKLRQEAEKRRQDEAKSRNQSSGSMAGAGSLRPF